MPVIRVPFRKFVYYAYVLVAFLLAILEQILDRKQMKEEQVWVDLQLKVRMKSGSMGWTRNRQGSQTSCTHSSSSLPQHPTFKKFMVLPKYCQQLRSKSKHRGLCGPFHSQIVTV